jgi:hypothetical protein
MLAKERYPQALRIRPVTHFSLEFGDLNRLALCGYSSERIHARIFFN